MYNFKIEKCNILDKVATALAICVTTNGVVKSNGELVMGAGVAKQFAIEFPSIPGILGAKVSKYGNHVYECGSIYDTTVLSFPTKHNYKDKSDLELIKQSAKRLVKWANVNSVESESCIYIPSPGTGLGGLDKSVVYNELNKILDNRFVICTK